MEYRRRRGTRALGQPLHLMTETGEEEIFAEQLTIRGAVAGLPHAHRATLLLYYVGGYSLQETAALLAIPVNTVRSRLQRARQMLRPHLAPLFGDYDATRRTTTTKGYTMPQTITTLSADALALITDTFPGSKIVSVGKDGEAWMPFSPQVMLRLAGWSGCTTATRLFTPGLWSSFCGGGGRRAGTSHRAC